MGTTPIWKFTTPDDTRAVRLGALDIRTLAGQIDGTLGGKVRSSVVLASEANINSTPDTSVCAQSITMPAGRMLMFVAYAAVNVVTNGATAVNIGIQVNGTQMARMYAGAVVAGGSYYMSASVVRQIGSTVTAAIATSWAGAGGAIAFRYQPGTALAIVDLGPVL